jgi:hypothetical protein
MELIFARRRPLLRAAAIGGIGVAGRPVERYHRSDVQHEGDQDQGVLSTALFGAEKTILRTH